MGADAELYLEACAQTEWGSLALNINLK